MKTFFALLIICILGFIPVSAQNKRGNKTDRERYELKGSVKKVEMFRIEFLPQDVGLAKVKRPGVTMFFDVDGRLAEQIVYTDNGESRNVYKYNLKGENIEINNYYPSYKDKNQTRVQTTIQTFDDRGNLLERSIYEHEGNPGARFAYKYDEKGNEIEYRNYYHTGKLGGRTVSDYNENGDLISRISYNADDTLNWKVLYIVDSKKRIIEESRYEGEILRYKILSEYDGKGRILQQETIEFNAIPNVRITHAPEAGKIAYFYDDENNIIEKFTFDENGTAKNAVVKKYDDKGEEIETSWYKSGSSFNEIMQTKNKTLTERRKLLGILQWKVFALYEYDAHGNWTNKTRLSQTPEQKHPALASAEEQVITYY